MRILDPSSDRAIEKLAIYLTPEEAAQLAAYCGQLASDPVGLHHCHLSEFGEHTVEREITVAVYVDENLNQFDLRSRRLIETGE